MSSPVFDRRRSERFAELLDEMSGRRRHHRRTELDGDLATLVRLVGRVGTAREGPDPGAEFRTGLRSVLLATIDREGIGVTAAEKAAEAAKRAALAGKTQKFRQVGVAGTGRARAAVLIGVTAGALALSGVSAASTDSLPGDPLYQVKRSSERAQLALAGSDQSRGQLYLEFAHSRLQEARRVDAAHLEAVLDDMNRETVAGVSLLASAAVQRGDAGALKVLDWFVREQRVSLSELHKTLPVAGVEPVGRSLALLTDVEKRASDLTSALATGCDVSAVDRLGPKPADNC